MDIFTNFPNQLNHVSLLLSFLAFFSDFILDKLIKPSKKIYEYISRLLMFIGIILLCFWIIITIKYSENSSSVNNSKLGEFTTTSINPSESANAGDINQSSKPDDSQKEISYNTNTNGEISKNSSYSTSSQTSSSITNQPTSNTPTTTTPSTTSNSPSTTTPSATSNSSTINTPSTAPTPTSNLIDEDEELRGLLMVIESNNLYAVQKYLKLGININRSIDGFTPLTCASRTNVSIVGELIKHSANVNLADSLGYTPIIIAVNSGLADITELLLANGADPNALYQENESALHISTARKSIECMRLLIKYGANINKKESRSETPIFYAVTTESVESVQLLIDSGADLSIKDTYGLTPLATARLGNNSEIITLLQRYNAPE